METINGIDDLLGIDGMMEKELRESVIHKEADNKDYVEYMARRPRSQGLFGNIDTSDLKEVSSEIASLTKSGRIIYRGIISLGEKDGEELGFRNIDAWNNYLKRVMPEIAQKLGVSSYDHTWVAAFHAEEKHPHVHYMLWDNQDKIKSPYIHKATQQKIRIYLEEEMFNNEYERSVKLAYAQEHEEANAKRNMSRAQVVDKTEQTIREAGFVPGVEYEKLPTRASNDYLRKIAAETVDLIEKLPEKGSFKYRYLPSEAKEQVNKLVDLLLEKPDLKKAFDTYLEGVETSQQLQGRTKTKINSAVNKESEDVRKRIANRILSTIKPVVLHENIKMPDVFVETEISKDTQNIQDIQDMWERRVLYEPKIIEEENVIEDLPLESKNGAELRADENVTVTEQQYFIDWSDGYRTAMDLLYGEETDVEKAFDILEKEAISGNALAIFEAEKIIDKELLKSLDPNEAAEYYDEAYSAFEKIYYSTDDNYKKQYAAYRIGKFYTSALGTIEEPDYEEAEKWLKRATGNKYAQYSLGKLYLQEKIYVSAEKDSLENQKAALQLFKKSAQRKNPFASYELGKMYTQGIGTGIDLEKGQSHYEHAFMGFLGMSEKSTDDTLFYRLGRMYLDGLGTEKNEETGEKYIHKAAELGNEPAKLSLATIYLTKDDENKRRQAIRILEKLADSDRKHPMAQYKLGAIYADKELPVYNLEKAIGYLEKSAKQGNQFAQCKLGVMYYYGKDVPKNEDLGKYWLQCAAEQGNQFAQDVLNGGGVIGINFSYCLLKGILTSLENLNRQVNYNNEIARTQSRQAAREKYLHRDQEQE